MFKYDFSQWPKTVYHTKVYEINFTYVGLMFVVMLLVHDKCFRARVRTFIAHSSRAGDAAPAGT